ncbi:MAG TPA: FecR domain-containing protein [Myxococcota bacterium]|nr:FecR domain-containing protein [Myxococcota bacterium]
MDSLDQFRRDTEPTPQSLSRVEARILAAPQPRSWGIPAMAALSLGLAGLLFWALRPVPEAAPPEQSAQIGVPADSALTPTPLEGEAGRTEVVDGKVALVWNGRGSLGGTRGSPLVNWDRGLVEVEVEPNQGIHLSVQTREATVKVVGTGFEVRRDMQGTSVLVRHGKVEVTCADGGPSVLLGAGQQRLCAPTTAVGMLARARARQGAGAPAAELLPLVEQGLTAADRSEVVEGELNVMKVQLLQELDRKVEALQTAEAYLQNPAAPRLVEMHRVAAALGMVTSGCDAAKAHLRVLRKMEPKVADLRQLAVCVRGESKEEANSALELALTLTDTKEERAAIRAELRSGM